MGDGPCNSLEIFYRNYSSIYIYGAGVCGKNLALYLAGYYIISNNAVMEKAKKNKICSVAII